MVELDSNQEEADTQMLLHAKHASSTYTTAVIATLDTDVFMITLSKQSEIQVRIFILTGTREKRHLIENASFIEMHSSNSTKQSAQRIKFFMPCQDSIALLAVIPQAYSHLMGTCQEYVEASSRSIFLCLG